MAEVWIFAYGSLMWNPGFNPQDRQPARLNGWHRSMCILSTMYRGTQDRPGLVLGLDRGGSCRGQALCVPPGHWPQVQAALDARELVTGVYTPRFLPVRLDDGRQIAAYTYVVRRDHRQYWRGSEQQAIHLIRQGCGQSGLSRDYLAHTVDQLRSQGLGGQSLMRLLRRVDQGS